MSELTIPVSAEDHRQGELDATCVLVEYGDYECPSCGRAYPTVKRLQKQFGKKLAFIFRNFPLNQMHPQAESAAEAAEFAGSHHKFWEMHDLLYENQERLGEELLGELAEKLDLAPAELKDALAKREFRPRVRADFTGGVRSGVNGTPTFFINGERHDGAFAFEFLVEAIEQTLSSKRD